MVEPILPEDDLAAASRDTSSEVTLMKLLTWLGESKRLLAISTGSSFATALVVALLLPATYTARTILLPPGTQQQGGSTAAFAALGSLGSLAGGLGGKTPDELYVALLKSDSVLRALDERYALKQRYDITSFESLRKVFPTKVRASTDKKSGVISIEVDDKDPVFAAELANAHATEITKILSRLAVSEAQQRRLFFEKKVKDAKENLIRAEIDLKVVQEKSGVIVLEKQAEELVSGAAQVRAAIAEREVRLKVGKISATERNPDMIRLTAEIQAMRSELARMESIQGGQAGSSVDIPVGKIPGAALDYVRARRELKLQETLLEGMIRQLELARLDEAKEGPELQQIDRAVPPDYKSKPSRALVVLTITLLTLLCVSSWILIRRYNTLRDEDDPFAAKEWLTMKRSWALKR